MMVTNSADPAFEAEETGEDCVECGAAMVFVQKAREVGETTVVECRECGFRVSSSEVSR